MPWTIGQAMNSTKAMRNGARNAHPANRSPRDPACRRFSLCEVPVTMVEVVSAVTVISVRPLGVGRVRLGEQAVHALGEALDRRRRGGARQKGRLRGRAELTLEVGPGAGEP